MLGEKKESYFNSAAVFSKHMKYQTELSHCLRYYEGQFSQYSKAVRSMGQCRKNTIQRDCVFTKYMTHKILDSKQREVPSPPNDER